MPLAILQMADTPQIESSAVMLRAAGYDTIKICGPILRQELQRAGCDTVLSLESMIALGYDSLDSSIEQASSNDMGRCDLFVEIKVRNIAKIRERWPRLRSRVVWWRVNGAQPEICPRGGDEVNLPCPVITACFWYGCHRYRQPAAAQSQSLLEHEASRPITLEGLLDYHRQATPAGDFGMAYTFWPPYPRSAEYDRIDRAKARAARGAYREPYCLCHNVRAWGYGEIVDDVAALGVSFYGNGSPHSQVSHRQVPGIALDALALVHLKSVDCPGWALYEALLAGCPVVIGRLLNSRMLAYDLLKDGETCLEFGVPASLEYGRGDPDLSKCLADIRTALERLKDSAENRRIGEAGRRRLNELMWRADRHGDSFHGFMRRWFP